MYRMRVPLLLFAFVSLASGSAGAAIPSPSTSTVDPCFVVCPFGDIAFHVTVRDIANNPVANSSVLVDFCSCPGVHFCPQDTCPEISHTDILGRVTFLIHAGGTCPDLSVRISADGVLLATRRVASTDQDGDLDVDAQDRAIANSKVGSGDPTADLNCDSAVTAADVTYLEQHLGHDCFGAVPTLPSTWGKVRAFYR